MYLSVRGERERDRQTDRQTETERDRERQRDREPNETLCEIQREQLHTSERHTTETNGNICYL